MLIVKSNAASRPGEMGGGLGVQLDRLEVLISKLGTGVEQPVEILELMDRVEARFSELDEQGAAVPEAAAQYEACQAALRSAAGAFLKEMGGSGALQAARQAKNPERAAWWWFLDEYQAGQRQARLRNGLKAALIAGVVLVVLGIIYQSFFAPDPKTLAVYSSSGNADQLAGQGKYAEALVQVEKGLAVVPDSRDLLVRQGVLLDQLGKGTQAGELYARALGLSSSQEQFYLLRSQVYLAFGKFDLAMQDGQAAIAANPDSAIGYMLVGTAQELQGKLREAYANYVKAQELAEIQKQDSLTAQIKIKLAYLVQNLSSPVFQSTQAP